MHLANLPENRAFFAGTIDSAGSFGGIFQSSVLAYGSVIKNPTDPARFVDTSFLDALAKQGLFADQKIAIAPIKTASQGALEGDPLLSKDIRFFFEPNSATLDKNAPQNLEYLDTIKRFLQVSPGSTVLLRGHVDNAHGRRVPPQGGEQLVKSMALKAMELSRQRALAVQRRAARAPQGHRRVARRGRRPRLGGAGRPRQRPEPPRRGAVVHAGVRAERPRRPAPTRGSAGSSVSAPGTGRRACSARRATQDSGSECTDANPVPESGCRAGGRAPPANGSAGIGAPCASARLRTLADRGLRAPRPACA